MGSDPRRWRVRIRGAVLSLAASLTVMNAAGQVAAPELPGVPPAITPGGAAPVPIDRSPLPTPTPDPVPIPPAVQRPLAVEEGERVLVVRFELAGVMDRPRRRISKAEIEALVESLRREKQGLPAKIDRGSASPEAGELLNGNLQGADNQDPEHKIDERRPPAAEPREVQGERPRGMTVGELQEIANEVTRYYRKAGFILAQAFIPAQDVKHGVVKIEVVEGQLGEVIVQGSRRYPPRLLARPFGRLIDAPVIGPEVESALLTVSDYAGLSTYGVFRPGELPGTTDLVLKVQDEDLLDGVIRIDNYGTRFTGQDRLVLDLKLNNPLRLGDRLDVSLIQTYVPKESIYGRVQYQAPVYTPRNLLGAGFSSNTYDVAGSLRELEIGGLSQVANAFLRRTIVRSRRRNVYATLGFASKLAETESAGRVVTRDKLSIVSLEGTFDSINAGSASIQGGALRWDHGLEGVLGSMDRESAQTARPPPSRRRSDGTFVGGRFDKLNLTYARLKNLSRHQSLLFRFNGQYSPDPLVSVEQFTLGGPNSVRAYPVSEFLADYGFFTSLEWSIKASQFTGQSVTAGNTWGDMLRLALFVDYGAGWLNDPLANEFEHAEFSGAGIGLHFDFPWDLSAGLEVAHRLGREVPSDGSDTRAWFGLQFNF